ncbi:MAG: DoxX family protein [Flavobacteriales bacterium]
MENKMNLMKIAAVILIAVSVLLNLKHGWDALHLNDAPEQLKMMSDLGISKTFVPFLGIFSLLLAVMVLFPQTFFAGNLLNAVSIVWIMALALRAENIKMALIEIPFLALPLVLIWLKHPLRH